jgi:hypothetical protein
LAIVALLVDVDARSAQAVVRWLNIELLHIERFTQLASVTPVTPACFVL